VYPIPPTTLPKSRPTFPGSPFSVFQGREQAIPYLFSLLISKLRHNADEHKRLFPCLGDLMEDIGRDIGCGTWGERVVLAIHEQHTLTFHTIDDMLPRMGMTGCKASLAKGEHPHDVVLPSLGWAYEYLFGNLVGRGTVYLLFLYLVTM